MEIKEYIKYDETSPTCLSVIKTYHRNHKVGDPVGSVGSDGYYVFTFKSRQYRNNRVVWLLVHGEEPPKNLVVDHIDRDPKNNLIDNLRLLTHAENHQNTNPPKNNKSGHKGLFWQEERGRWLVYRTLDGKRHHIGRYLEKEDALLALSQWLAENNLTHLDSIPLTVEAVDVKRKKDM